MIVVEEVTEMLEKTAKMAEITSQDLEVIIEDTRQKNLKAQDSVLSQ